MRPSRVNVGDVRVVAIPSGPMYLVLSVTSNHVRALLLEYDTFVTWLADDIERDQLELRRER